MEEDLEIFLVKLDLEKSLLLIWGSAVGVLKADDEGRVLELKDPQRTKLIERCLESIKSLLSERVHCKAHIAFEHPPMPKMQRGRSGNIISTNSMSVFSTSHRRF